MSKRSRPLALSATTYALLYTRVSGSEHQKDGLSLAAQDRETRRFLAAHPQRTPGDTVTVVRRLLARFDALGKYVHRKSVGPQRAPFHQEVPVISE
jgi:hypothetical protein